MLKNIFLPNSINNYYIFGQRIVGLDIKKTKIVACQIYISGSKIKIEKVITEKILDNLTGHIKNVFEKLDKPDEIRLSLPNSLATFKNLNLPFLDKNKISMVIPFEVEGSIPFSINNSRISFIINEQNKKEKTSNIVVGVTQSKNVKELENFIDNDLKNKISNISIDIISNFSLIKNSLKLNQKTLLLDLSYASTTIALIEQENLSTIRTITKGLSNLVKNISQKYNLNLDEALQHLERVGKEKYSNEISDFIKDVSNEILFTLNSLDIKNIEKILIVNFDLSLDIENELKENLGIETSYFDSNLIINKNTVTNIGVKLKSEDFTSLSIAIPNKINSDFNLLETKTDIKSNQLFKSQVIATLILTITLIGSLAAFKFIKSNQLQGELEKSKKELISAMKNSFEINDASLLKSPTRLIKSIESKVNEEESLWFSFSKKTRFSFLKYLEKISTSIDAKKIGLNLKNLSLSEGSIILSGSVPNFESLKELEESLNKSGLFSKISTPQETEFNITLTIKKDELA